MKSRRVAKNNRTGNKLNLKSRNIINNVYFPICERRAQAKIKFGQEWWEGNVTNINLKVTRGFTLLWVTREARSESVKQCAMHMYASQNSKLNRPPWKITGGFQGGVHEQNLLAISCLSTLNVHTASTKLVFSSMADIELYRDSANVKSVTW